jgi:hypothetical protein
MKKAEIKWRLVLPIQTKGDLGKSSEAESFGCYLEQRGIEWRGFDLDADNRSFSSRFPERVKLVETGGEQVDAIIAVLKRAGEVNMTRWDVRAHMSDAILEALRLTRFQEQAAERGGRVTVVFFPQDNIDVMSDMDGIAEALGGSVDYLIVKNRFKSAAMKMYEASQLQKDLLALGAGEMEMPVLLNSAKNPLAKLSLTQGRNVTVGEAVKDGELPLDFTARLVIEDWLQKMYAGYDRNARILLPAAEAARVAPPPAESELGPKARRSTKRINLSNL